MNMKKVYGHILKIVIKRTEDKIIQRKLEGLLKEKFNNNINSKTKLRLKLDSREKDLDQKDIKQIERERRRKRNM